MMAELNSRHVRAGFVTHDGSAESPVANDVMVDVFFNDPYHQKRYLHAGNVDWTLIFAYRVSRRQS